MALHHNSQFNCPGHLKSMGLKKTIMVTKSRPSITPSSEENKLTQKCL